MAYMLAYHSPIVFYAGGVGCTRRCFRCGPEGTRSVTEVTRKKTTYITCNNVLWRDTIVRMSNDIRPLSPQEVDALERERDLENFPSLTTLKLVQRLIATVRDRELEHQRLEHTIKFMEDSYLAEHENWGKCKWKAERDELQRQLAEARKAIALALSALDERGEGADLYEARKILDAARIARGQEEKR